MSQELNATCDICGKKYHICSSCKEVKSFTPWRTVTDTMQHYLIFLALSEYTKTKDKEKAKEELSKCDLSELDTFNENIKTVIREIMAEGKEKIVETVSEENVKENVEIKPQKSTRKSRTSVKQSEVKKMILNSKLVKL